MSTNVTPAAEEQAATVDSELVTGSAAAAVSVNTAD